jgi:hypothetical protein
MAKRGPKEKLTPEVTEKICQALRAGNFRIPSAMYAGVGSNTFCVWMRLGLQKPRSKYGKFRSKVLEAENAFHVGMVGVLRNAAANGDVKVGMWMLSRRAKDWADKQQQQKVNVDHRVSVELIEKKLATLPTDEMLRMYDAGRPRLKAVNSTDDDE